MLKVSSKWYNHFRCVWPGMPILPKITSLLFLCNILRKKWVMQLIFCMQISMKACFKLILWFWWRWSSIPKVPKIVSFGMPLQYLKEKVRDEVDFFHADKHQSFLQVDFNSLDIKDFWYYHYWWAWSSTLKVLKVTSLQCIYNIWEKKLGIESIFCMQMNIKISTSWHCHFWWK